MFYIRKIKDDHRIMSQALNKTWFLLSGTFPIILVFDAQQVSLHLDLINLPSAAFRLARKNA